MSRTESLWQEREGGYIETSNPSGLNILIKGTDKYLNFNAVSGSLGYGFRDNDGVMEFKDLGGTWAPFGSGGGGVTDHGALTGLSDDDHTQYVQLIGRSGGQIIVGGTGTTDDLVFQTTSGVGASGADMIFRGGNNGATEFARFLNTGFFGIGTTAPAAKLEVNTVVTPSTTVTAAYFSNKTTGTNAGASIRLGYDASTANTVGISGYYNTTNGSGTQLGFLIGTNERMTLGANGNFGIGTTTPTEKLNVAGNILATGTVLGSNLSGTNTGDNAVNTLYSGLVSNATHTGDVTGSTALTIANGAVTLAKMANVATGTIFYRKTASTGVPEVQTLATLKTDLVLVKGDVGLGNVDNTSDATKNSATATLANKTITSPRFSAYDKLASSSGATIVELGYFGTPVNYIGIETAEAGNNPTFYAAGTDTNIGFQLTPKGTGRVQVGANPVLTTTSTDTVTNKTMIASTNVIEEITTTTSSTTPTPTGGSLRNFFTVTALATNATFGAPSGTPVNGNVITMRVTPDATPRTLAYNAIYRAIGVTLPTTTVASKTMYFGMKYNSLATKWDIIAYGIEA